MKRFKKMIIVFLIALVLIVTVVPHFHEQRIRKDAPALLKLNNYKIIKEGDYHILSDQVTYVVENMLTHKRDTIHVQLTRSTIVIQP